MQGFLRSNRLSIVLGVAAMLIAGLAVVPTLVVAQNQAPAPAAGAAAPNLERNMSAMNRAWRAIKAGASDKTKNDATLAALATMQTATLAAKVQTPAILEKLTGDEKAKKVSAYRKEIIKLLRQELDLEDLLLNGDNDKAKELVTAIDATQTAGHKEFRAAD